MKLDRETLIMLLQKGELTVEAEPHALGSTNVRLEIDVDKTERLSLLDALTEDVPDAYLNGFLIDAKRAETKEGAWPVPGTTAWMSYVMTNADRIRDEKGAILDSFSPETIRMQMEKWIKDGVTPKVTNPDIVKSSPPADRIPVMHPPGTPSRESLTERLKRRSQEKIMEEMSTAVEWRGEYMGRPTPIELSPEYRRDEAYSLKREELERAVMKATRSDIPDIVKKAADEHAARYGLREVDRRAGIAVDTFPLKWMWDWLMHASTRGLYPVTLEAIRQVRVLYLRLCEMRSDDKRRVILEEMRLRYKEEGGGFDRFALHMPDDEIAKSDAPVTEEYLWEPVMLRRRFEVAKFQRLGRTYWGG